MDFGSCTSYAMNLKGSFHCLFLLIFILWENVWESSLECKNILLLPFWVITFCSWKQIMKTMITVHKVSSAIADRLYVTQHWCSSMTCTYSHTFQWLLSNQVWVQLSFKNHMSSLTHAHVRTQRCALHTHTHTQYWHATYNVNMLHIMNQLNMSELRIIALVKKMIRSISTLMTVH